MGPLAAMAYSVVLELPAVDWLVADLPGDDLENGLSARWAPPVIDLEDDALAVLARVPLPANRAHQYLQRPLGKADRDLANICHWLESHNVPFRTVEVDGGRVMVYAHRVHYDRGNKRQQWCCTRRPA